MRLKLPEYRWALDKEKDSILLHEGGTIQVYTKQQLEKVIEDTKAEDRPTVKCGYQFERNRALKLVKLQAGLDLWTRSLNENQT